MHFDHDLHGLRLYAHGAEHLVLEEGLVACLTEVGQVVEVALETLLQLGLASVF